jgi:uncharacterized cupredoxin-like copper-binding protein
MKKIILGLLLGLLLSFFIATLTANKLVATAISKQPVEVRVILGRSQAGEYAIESPITTFKMGVPYRFVIRNAGRKLHEFLILPRGNSDTRQALVAVEEDDLRPNSVVVRELTFSKSGNYEFACRYSNHYERGMVLPIVVK